MRDELRERVIKDGLDIGSHEMAFTSYPRGTDSRLNAINEWLSANRMQSAPWVALDDAEIDSPNAVRINPRIGIDFIAYETATRILGVPDSPVFLL